MTTAQETTPAATRPPGSSDERVMRCSRCNGEWKTPAPRPEAPVHCPFCNVHLCGCGCGADLSLKRTDAIYEAESHWRRLERAASTDIAPTRTVAEARRIQEDAKGHWSMIVREGICEVLRTTGYFHADDLAHLGIPDEHRNIIGSQTAKLVNQKWMVKRGERRSISPGRNSAKSGIYQLTALGRKSLAGVGAAATGTVGADPGEDPGGIAAVAPPAPPGPEPVSAPRAGAEGEQHGEGTAVACAAPSTGPTVPSGAPNPSGAGSEGQLPGLEPSAYDRMQDAA